MTDSTTTTVTLDEHESGCIRVAGAIGCSCGATQRRLWAEYFERQRELAKAWPTCPNCGAVLPCLAHAELGAAPREEQG